MKLLISLLLVLSPVAGAQPFDAPPAMCEFAGEQVPKNVRVYAAGGYAGRKLDHQIDQSGHTATQFDLVVNSPDEPVALLLGAYEPTIWSVSWTRGTRILAVIVSGYHRQAVAGLDASVPLINSSHDNKGPCGYFYVGSDRPGKSNELSLKLFGKTVEREYAGGRDGRIFIGQPISSSAGLQSSRDTRPESFHDRSAPLAGKAGINDALAKGLLRPATPADADAWFAAASQRATAGGRAARKPSHLGAYTVIKPFTFPSGLYGAHSEMFFVAEGVPKPSGNPGHSTVLDINALKCAAPSCDDAQPGGVYGPRAAVTGRAIAVPAASATAGANYGAAVSIPAHGGLRGRAAIDDAVERGVLRLATRKDVDAWMEIAGPGVARPPTSNSYVVLGAWAFPPGLTGENAARFFVPLGGPMPMGGAGAGDSAVYDFRKRNCRGKLCE